jgi:hypothetical protein
VQGSLTGAPSRLADGRHAAVLHDRADPAGRAFLTLSMGYIGLPRHLAEWIGALGLSQFG